MPSSKSSSKASKAAATRRHARHQMDVDSPNADPCSSAPSSPALVANDAPTDEQLLISPTSRLSRPPSTVPSPHTSSSPLPPVAIPAQPFSTSTTSTSQDVHHFVNNSTSSSTVTRTGQSPLETSVSSFPPPLTRNGLKNPLRRPTFGTNLAEQYGIPQVLPPPPQPSSRYINETASPQTPDAYLEQLQAFTSNYTNMLNNTQEAGFDLQSDQDFLNEPVIPFDADDMSGPLISSAFNEDDFLTSPDLGTFASPHLADGDDTPFSAFLDTPVIDADDATYNYTSLFPEASAKQQALDFESLLQMTPNTPMLDSFDDMAVRMGALATQSPVAVPVESFAPVAVPTAAALPPPTPALAPRRRPGATGTRKGITPDNLLDEDAPTQPRKYVTPSATSRKAVPAVFRKRSRSTAFPDEEDELESTPAEVDISAIEAKRRSNTVAARRSRKRKLEEQQALKSAYLYEKSRHEYWQTTAMALVEIMRASHLPSPNIVPDQPYDYSLEG